MEKGLHVGVFGGVGCTCVGFRLLWNVVECGGMWNLESSKWKAFLIVSACKSTYQSYTFPLLLKRGDVGRWTLRLGSNIQNLKMAYAV